MSEISQTSVFVNPEELDDAAIRIMMLRKPTPLKSILGTIPIPKSAVPPNALPQWLRLDLDRKLPVPKIPPGKIIFSRGYIGENVRRPKDDHRPTFDLTDPNCTNVSYEYDAVHDPHLARYFAQLPAKTYMTQLGFATEDGHALCTLKQFNTFRKFLYNKYMDQVHETMKMLDSRAREDLTLLKVERDVARNRLAFQRRERAREKMEAAMGAAADDIAEKKRLAKENAAKAAAHIEYMLQMKERQRLERAQRSKEQSEKISQRVKAASEMELRRKITMIRQWRKNERRRLQRLQRETEAKKRRELEDVNRKWEARISDQNQKIAQEKILLRLYNGNMIAGAKRRQKRSERIAYARHCELQRIKLANWRALHAMGKDQLLVRKVAHMFSKGLRGQKTVTPEQAQAMTRKALQDAWSGAESDPLGKLTRVRMRLGLWSTVPTGVTAVLDEWMTTVINEFARRRVCLVVRDVERDIYYEAAKLLEQDNKPKKKYSPPEQKRVRDVKLAAVTEIAGRIKADQSIKFGAVSKYSAEEVVPGPLRSVKDRPPTPVPSVSKLAKLTYAERVEDLPDPVVAEFPEQRKLLKSVNALSKLLTRTVGERVRQGMDLDTRKLTLPKGYRPKLDWNETVVELGGAVIDGRVCRECPEVLRGADFLIRRILTRLIQQIRRQKLERKAIQEGKLEFRITPLVDFAPGECSPGSDDDI